MGLGILNIAKKAVGVVRKLGGGKIFKDANKGGFLSNFISRKTKGIINPNRITEGTNKVIGKYIFGGGGSSSPKSYTPLSSEHKQLLNTLHGGGVVGFTPSGLPRHVEESVKKIKNLAGGNTTYASNSSGLGFSPVWLIVGLMALFGAVFLIKKK